MPRKVYKPFDSVADIKPAFVNAGVKLTRRVAMRHKDDGYTKVLVHEVEFNVLGGDKDVRPLWKKLQGIGVDVTDISADQDDDLVDTIYGYGVVYVTRKPLAK